VRDRYDGRKQNPWNDIECGDHYVRAMSSWALLEAASGYFYDAAANAIAFAPVIGADDFRAPFVTRDGWGTFSQSKMGKSLTGTIAIAHGTLLLERISLEPGITAGSVRVTLNGVPVANHLSTSDGTAAISFSNGLLITPDQSLSVELSV
jgi:hypothetical protein